MSRDHDLVEQNMRLDSTWRRLLGRAAGGRRVGRILSLFLIAFLVFSVLNPRVFLSPLNLQNIGLASPEIGVLAIAMMLAMLTGGIDLSVVAIANLSAITVSTIFISSAESNPASAESLTPVLVVVALAVGLVAGLINGLLIGVLGVTPILATLATMQIFNGLAIVWTGGKTLYGAPEAFTVAGKAAIGGVPVLFVLFVLIAIAIAILLSRTTLGARIELLGANPVAARFSGIGERRTLMATYALTGVLGGVAGLLFLMRNPTASADYGSSYVLLVIVIAILGGTNPNGGFATVAGVVLAALTLQVVQSGFTSLRLSSYEYAIAQGVILVVVMVLDQVKPWQRLRKQKQLQPAALPPDLKGTSHEEDH